MVETSRQEPKYSVVEDVKPKATRDEGYKMQIYWPNFIALTSLHALAVYGFTLRSETTTIGEFYVKLVGLVASLGITAGAHRLWCHRSYKARLPAQLLIMFMASLTYQNSVYIWCRDHRLHHKYSETDADPHNAKRGFFFSHVGWLVVRKHPAVKSKKNTVDMSDLEANPVVMFQHKYYYYIMFLSMIGMTTILPWYLWNESLKVAFFRLTIYRYILSVNLTWCINSFAHLYGNKPYDKNIGPVESTPIHYVCVGESYHNYHHTFPWDYKAAEFGNDTKNLTTYLIDFLAYLGWVYDRKTVPKEIIKRRISRTGDGGFNTNRTFFHKYLPQNTDTFLRNTYNLMITGLFLYMF